MTSSTDLERAVFDPASVFASPRDVVDHGGLSARRKIEILRDWGYDAAEQAVALEEGMPGDDDDRLREILLALEQVEESIDFEHVGPSKQHGLRKPVT